MKKIILIISLILLCNTNVYAKEKITFQRCVDGDTFKGKINGEVKYIRLLAIDTPESVEEKIPEPFGKEASEYTCNILTNAKKIEIEFDPKSDREDKYERVLGYIYADDIMVEKELLKEGLAEVAYIYDDYKYVNELREIEKIAKKNKVGMWQDEVKEIEQEKDIWETILDFIIDLFDKIIDKLF